MDFKTLFLYRRSLRTCVWGEGDCLRARALNCKYTIGLHVPLAAYNQVQLHSPDHDPDPVAVNDNDGGFCLRVQVQPDSA